MSNRLDISGHGRILPFRDAATAVCRLYRKQKTDAPLLSHALSVWDSNHWIVMDIESNQVAIVSANGKAVLIESIA